MNWKTRIGYEGKRVAVFKDPALPTFLEQLRKQGLCILDGQIEDLVKPNMIDVGQKLKLSHIYQIRERITNGGKLSEFFDLSPFKQCFATVFKQ